MSSTSVIEELYAHTWSRYLGDTAQTFYFWKQIESWAMNTALEDSESSARAMREAYSQISTATRAFLQEAATPFEAKLLMMDCLEKFHNDEADSLREEIKEHWVFYSAPHASDLIDNASDAVPYGSLLEHAVEAKNDRQFTDLMKLAKHKEDGDLRSSLVRLMREGFLERMIDNENAPSGLVAEAAEMLGPRWL